MNSRNPRWLHAALIAVLTFVVSLFAVSRVQAHKYSPAFLWSNGGWMGLQGNHTSYEWAVQSAARDLDSTDLNVYYTTYRDPTGVVTFYEGYYNRSAYAWAEPRRRDQYGNEYPCFNSSGALTGHCDTGGNRANTGYVYLNLKGGTGLSDRIEGIARHEPGHHLGLDHTSCSESSVMRGGDCSVWLNQLGSHDFSDINYNY